MICTQQNLTVIAMSTKTDVEAIRLIGDEVVRLLSLPEDQLESQVRAGLKLIGDLARWRDLAGISSHVCRRRWRT